MSTQEIIAEIRNLPLADCLAVAQAVRDRLAPENLPPLTVAEAKAVLDERIEDARLNPGDESPWEEVSRTLRTRPRP